MPFSFSMLIDFVTPGSPDGEKKEVWVWQGYLYAVLLFVSAFVQTLFMAQYSHRMYLTGMRSRTVLVSAIYRKALVISNAAKRGKYLSFISTAA